MPGLVRIIFKNWASFSIAVVGLIGGLIWGYNSNWDYEPLILSGVSALQILGFLFIKNSKDDSRKDISASEENQTIKKDNQTKPTIDLNLAVEPKKSKVKVLFIDDDTKFKVVKILKDSGWRFTKSVQDIKSLDLSIVKEADIVFVDINGVGKVLKLEFEGLDLAYMLKQKYREKKIIIYSAKRDTNAFHQAWDVIDYRLEKNALPYQFQNLVEKYSLEYYN